MATAADIGASFSNYQGNAGLGAVNGNPINIDTRPLQQLAAYTNMYNKSVWEQNQADTAAKINQLAKLSDINVASLHGKDRDEFGQIWSSFLKDASDFARKTPQTPEEKVQQQLDWQVKYGKIAGLYDIAKQRSLSYLAKLNTIATSDSDAERQDVQKSQLDKEFDNTDITTPLSAMPQYKMEDISLPKPVTQELANLYVGGDQNSTVKSKIFNPALNAPLADATVLGIKRVYPQKGTAEYENLSDNEKQQADQQATIQSQGKIWSDMVVPLNSILQTKDVNGKLLYYDENGNFKSEQFENDNAANSVIMQPYNALKSLNGYSKDHYNQAVNGVFNDKGLDYTLPSADNSKLANDFKAGFVDFKKPITPTQLVLAGTYSQYAGDTFEKTLTETGKETQLKIAREGRASAERIAAGTQAGENYRKNLDLIGKGWELDAKGKLKPPTKNSSTTGTNGGIVPYWQNYIVPQIQSTKGKMQTTTGKTGGIFGFFQKDVKENIPSDYTGDVEVAPDKISGLSVALLGEKTADGKQKGISGHGDDPTQISVRFDKGNPIGVVIDGVFYDQNDINSKATQLNDKTLTNKVDSPIFDNGDNSEQTQQSVPKLTDAQKYLQSLKSK
jgi:hypothetical protein